MTKTMPTVKPVAKAEMGLKAIVANPPKVKPLASAKIGGL